MLSDTDLRSAQIRAIHVAKRQLRLDDDTYRAIVRRVSARYGHPVTSSADMHPRERAALLDELRNHGFRRVAEPAKSIAQGAPQTKFIRAMWALLHEREQFREPEKVLRGFCKRVTGKDAVNWLDAHDANRLIEAIKARLQRGADAQAQEPADDHSRV